MNVEVFALHGFLGSPADWKPTFDLLRQEKPDWQLHAVDLFADSHPGQSMQEWANSFNQRVRHRNSSRRILLGYSMGGRLALHALAERPQIWSGAVFLSTNPGLQSPEEKLERVSSDQKWSERFAHEELTLVLKDWNAQPVFSGSQAPLRELHREQCVQALTSWSLGVQKNFREVAEIWSTPQIWAAGEEDSKFVGLLSTLPSTQTQVIPGASHRLPFEAPKAVSRLVLKLNS